MKNFYLSLFLIAFSFHTYSQAGSPRKNVPNGEEVIIAAGVTPQSNILGRDPTRIVVTNKQIEVTASVHYISGPPFTAPAGTEIKDVRFKFSKTDTKRETILVLLTDNRVFEVTLDGFSNSVKPLKEITMANFYAEEILGDDLYIMGYEGVFVSDSGYSWTFDTAGLNKAYCFDIDIDTFERVWLCTSNGLFTQELNATTWIKNTNYTVVGCDHVFVDRNQYVWVSYSNILRVSKNRGASFQNAPSGLLSIVIRDICDDKYGNIYVMGDKTLYFSQGGTQPFVQIGQAVLTNFNSYSSLNVFNDIYGDSLIYLTTDAGLFSSADKGVTWKYDEKVKAEHFNSISATVNSRLLMTTNNGLFRLENGDTTWSKRYPSNGFIDGTKVFTASNGDLYLIAEKHSTNSSGSIRYMVYKSTDNGNTFIADTLGMKAADVAMTLFMVDEDGVQHATATVNQGGYYSRVWKKPVGQPWVYDTLGLPPNMNFNINPRCFGTGNNGKIYLAIMSNITMKCTIYSRPIAGGTWTSETVVNGYVNDIKGNSGIVTAGSDQGIKYDNGTGWKTAPLPAGVSSIIGYCSSTVGKNKVAWAYFDTYNSTAGIGEGIYYTTDFITWKKPQGFMDTILFGELISLGDSIFAITLNNEGIYMYDTTTSIGGGTGVNEGIMPSMKVIVLPNPFHEKTTLQFDLEKQSEVELIVYNMLGQIVLEIPNKRMDPGQQQIEINLPSSAKGLLFYSLKVNEDNIRGKLIRE